MREIKFRAWNEVEGFLDTAWSIDFEHRLVCHRAHNQSDLDDCVLMQYTGLQDTNGREIYEGDVYSTILTVGFGSKVIEHKKMSAVVFEKGGYFHDGFSLADVIECDENFKYEGNIYENPELLEGE